MNLKKTLILLSIGMLVLLSGCDFTSGDEDATLSAEQIMTAVAETVAANLSLTPQPTATLTPTATATATVTATASPTQTSSPTTAAVNPPASGGQTNSCDSAAFVSDVTIPDGTVLAPGATFTKTWRIKNAGTCTWNASYAAAFVSGTQMGGTSPQTLTGEVGPGSSVDISIAMTAPTTPGSYTGYWQLQNAAGVGFAQSFYVQIQVSGDAATSVTPTATPTGPTPTPTITPTGPTPTTVSGKPDLKVVSMAFDPSPSKGASFTVRVEIKNVGDADAGAFVLEWWSDASNEDANTKKGWNVSGLAAGESKTLEHTCECYDNAGDYTSKALVDASGQVDENDESNNVMTSAVSVK